jgi:hypothetical protein
VREGDQSLVQEPHFDYDEVDGALVVDAFDARNGMSVWHGSSRAEINPDRADEALLEASVTDLFVSFPTARAAAR